MRIGALPAAIVMTAALLGRPAAAQEKIKVGYWTSGFSVGFGAVLEAGKFLDQAGLSPEYVRFGDVNGPTKALLTQSIDVAFAAATTGGFALAIQGVPVELVLATQIGEATFVAKEGSPLAKLSDLKGKKLGMSPAGSAMYGVVAALLERNHGLKTSDYTAVPGNEGQLVRFLEQGDIDAASLRAVTIASVPDLKLRRLGTVPDEWKTMTRSNAVPIIGVSVVHRDYARQHADAVVKFVRGMIAATEFGARETEKASEMLSRAANLDARDATTYARLWNQIYMARMAPEDVETLKTMAQIFKATGVLESSVPDSLFVTAPYERAKRQQ